MSADGRSAQRVGDVVRAARLARGLSVEAAAEQADVAPKTWTRAEAGQNIRAGSWAGIASALGLAADAFLEALQRPDGYSDVAGSLGVRPPDRVWFRNVADSARGIFRAGDPDLRVEPGGEVGLAATVVREGEDAYLVRHDVEHQARPLPKDTWLLVADDHSRQLASTAAGPAVTVTGGGTLSVGDSGSVDRWGPVPLRSARSEVGMALMSVANVEPRTPAVAHAMKLLREALDALLDEESENG